MNRGLILFLLMTHAVVLIIGLILGGIGKVRHPLQGDVPHVRRNFPRTVNPGGKPTADRPNDDVTSGTSSDDGSQSSSIGDQGKLENDDLDEPRAKRRATEMFSTLARMNRVVFDPEDIVRIFGQLDDLTEADGKYFAELYRNELKQPREDAVALSAAFSMLLVCGGKEATDLLLDRLADPRASEAEVVNIKNTISGVGGAIMPASRVPITAELYSAAKRLIGSSSVADQCAGLGLIGGFKSPEALNTARSFAEQNANLRVRAAAILAVGRLGDEKDLELIMRLRDGGSAADSRDPNAACFLSALDLAASKIRQRARESEMTR